MAADVDSKAEMPSTVADPMPILFSRSTSAEKTILHAKLQKTNWRRVRGQSLLPSSWGQLRPRPAIRRGTV